MRILEEENVSIAFPTRSIYMEKQEEQGEAVIVEQEN
jgi:small-conductance mechanosensitive channel